MPEQQEKPKKVCKMCVVIRKVELLWHTLIKKKKRGRYYVIFTEHYCI